jgi:hypothetical protein
MSNYFHLKESEDNEVPLCYKCEKARAWRGECIDCYMKEHSSPYYMNGKMRYPDTHNILQGYYMEEEHYARMHRMQPVQPEQPEQAVQPVQPEQPVQPVQPVQPEKDAQIKASDKAENDFAKSLFQTIQGVKYDDKCPHGMPFYACMPCSH